MVITILIHFLECSRVQFEWLIYCCGYAFRGDVIMSGSNAAGSENIVKNGTNRCGNQQYWCKDCGARRVLEPKRDNPVKKKSSV